MFCLEPELIGSSHDSRVLRSYSCSLSGITFFTFSDSSRLGSYLANNGRIILFLRHNTQVRYTASLHFPQPGCGDSDKKARTCYFCGSV